ncbi:MAG: MMPL family transporter, partial [Nitrosomonadales bacterium]|nr:MMPL family transporter [Nitrosomonadales bacterium]
VSINNGEDTYSKSDREFLFKHRYLLSPAVIPEHFTVTGLQAALSESLDQLASPAGLLVKSLLPHDPTGEMMQLLGQLNQESLPSIVDGAWSSHDGNTALILAQTRASGSDTDAQQQAIKAIEVAFNKAALNQESGADATEAKLLMTGPGVFSVIARDTIKSQVTLIFIISTLLIAGLLLLVYRSFSALLLGFLPVATGIMAGIAAVSLGFGVVHGVTLGFGTALIGEAIDYSVYLFMQSDNQPEQRRNWIHDIWPTVRLGVLTSIFGFASLLLSGFPGLAQLGLYAIVGLTAAAIMTRYVLPHLLPSNFHIRDISAVGIKLSSIAQKARSLRWGTVLLLVIAIMVLYSNRNNLWNHELASLSPVPAADLALDTRLRAGMGAPDVRYLVVISGGSQEAVLSAAEQVSQQLQPLVEEGVLAGFESPSFYLPSVATQRARQESLPAPGELRVRLQQASLDLPLKPGLLDPFLLDVEAARQQPLLQRADLNNTSMAMAMDAMLVQQDQHWTSLMPLTAVASGRIDTVKVQAALKQTELSNVLFIDLKAESDNLYSGYLEEAIMLSLAGLLAIILLLLLVLRSVPRVAAVIAPLAASVLLVTAGLALAGQQLIILHLVGLLLV